MRAKKIRTCQWGCRHNPTKLEYPGCQVGDLVLDHLFLLAISWSDPYREAEGLYLVLKLAYLHHLVNMAMQKLRPHNGIGKR